MNTPSSTDQRAGFPPQKQDPPGLTEPMRPQPDHGEESYEGHGLLAGRHALITGGDSGIGRAVAIAFAREGADVAIAHLPGEEPDAQATAALVEQAGRKAVTIAEDLVDIDACQRVVAAAVDGLGGLDILVNNAGFHFTRAESGTLEGLEPDLVDRVFRTNIIAVLWLCQAALPHLRPGSAIINTSSIQAYEPSAKLLDYAATKSALNSVTVNLAEQLGPRGIRVNAVAPGPIWTPLQPATRTAEEIAHFGEGSPLGRAGQPAEVAPAYVFLAAERTASYVSGSILGVTGGQATF